MNVIDTSEALKNFDRDSLHSIHLSTIPLKTAALQRARLVKNVRFESVVEMFSGGEAGQGHLSISDLPIEFNWSEGNAFSDAITMRRLASLPSYDVFSLRIALRELGIEVNNVEALSLSDNMKAELSSYMQSFTRPLITEVFGKEGDIGDGSFDSIMNLFRSPDKKLALERLNQLAAKLKIEIQAVPVFLEDFGDLFLSLSYYRKCLDHIEPAITEFLISAGELKSSMQFREDRTFAQTVREIGEALNMAMAGLSGRFEAFDRATENLWDDISAAQFRKVESFVKASHRVNGGVLCLLTVKMDKWRERFPSANVGGPGRRTEFIQTEMKQGMGKIYELEEQAPKVSDMNI